MDGTNKDMLDAIYANMEPPTLAASNLTEDDRSK
ncbi:unnamed protein product, partial [Rotaria magnacalcarata]